MDEPEDVKFKDGVLSWKAPDKVEKDAIAGYSVELFHAEKGEKVGKAVFSKTTKKHSYDISKAFEGKDALEDGDYIAEVRTKAVEKTNYTDSKAAEVKFSMPENAEEKKNGKSATQTDEKSVNKSDENVSGKMDLSASDKKEDKTADKSSADSKEESSKEMAKSSETEKTGKSSESTGSTDKDKDSVKTDEKQTDSEKASEEKAKDDKEKADESPTAKDEDKSQDSKEKAEEASDTKAEDKTAVEETENSDSNKNTESIETKETASDKSSSDNKSSGKKSTGKKSESKSSEDKKDTSKNTEKTATPAPIKAIQSGAKKAINSIAKVFGIKKAEKKALPTPQNIQWNAAESCLTWDKVTVDDAENAVSGYIVSVYKDDKEFRIYDKTGSTSYDNINNVFEEAGAGSGSYVFKVKAVASEDSGYTYSEGESEAFTIPEVKVEKGAGISEVTASPSYLIPGSVNSVRITATVGDNQQFGKWTLSGNTAGQVTIDNETSEDTNVKISADTYTGEDVITLTATIQDDKAPIISSFSGNEATKTMTAEASDAETGIAYYAFSTAVSVEAVPGTDWQKATEGQTTFTKEISTTDPSGKYTFYVKDAAENVASSAETDGVADSIAVSQIRLDYTTEEGDSYIYAAGSMAQIVIFGTEKKAVSLPIPSRQSWEFKGWKYADSASSGTDDGNVESISLPLPASVELKPTWEVQKLGFSVEGYDGKTYDGQSHTISASVTNENPGDLTYHWYRKVDSTEGTEAHTENLGEGTSSYSVKDVADSGTYYAVISFTADDGQTYSNTSPDIAVSILPKPIYVIADDKTVTYGDPVPEYTYQTFDSYNETEKIPGDPYTLENGALTEGSLTCVYTPESPVTEDGYPIRAAGFSAGGNYAVTCIPGTLTVERVNANVEAGKVKAAFTKEKEYTYPVAETDVSPIAVTWGEKTLTPGTDYTLTYDIAHAGTGKVTVNFQGNFEGAQELTFTIQKAAYTAAVKLDDWVYCGKEERPTPSVEGRPEGAEEPVFYYVNGTVTKDEIHPESDTTEEPVNAGTYSVYGVIPENANYQEVITDPVTFTIEKLFIEIKADSASFEYNGSAHSAGGYTLLDKEGKVIDEKTFFPKGEGLERVSVEGTITDVSEMTETDENDDLYKPNVPSYEFNSITNPDNYEVIKKNGHLTMTAFPLAAPSYPHWDYAKPGLATWIAVTKNDHFFSYELQLFAEDEAGNVINVLGEDKSVAETSTSHNFAEEIRAFAEEHSDIPYIYYFKVRTVNRVVDAAEDNTNYSASDYVNGEKGKKTDYLHTAVVTTEYDPAKQDSTHILSMYFGKDNNTHTVVLLEGEKEDIHFDLEKGYKEAEGSWKLYRGSAEGEEESCLDFFDKNLFHDHQIRLADKVEKSIVGARIIFAAEDKAPTAYAYDAQNDETSDYSQVKLTFSAKDEVGLAYYAFTTDANVTKDSDCWQSIPDAEAGVSAGDVAVLSKTDKGAVQEATFTHVVNADAVPDHETPAYYAYVKDTDGNVTRAQYNTWDEGRAAQTGDSYEIIKVSFNAGLGDDTSQILPSRIKKANSEIPLPKQNFTNDGFAFQNWHGSTGIYEDGGTFAANQSDVLTASWTNEHYDFTVNYYYQGIDAANKGTYEGVVPETKTFNVLAEKKVLPTDADWQNPKDGFELDEEKNTTEALTIDGAGKSLSIYYRRKEYTVTKKVTSSDTGDITTEEKFLYGASLSDTFSKAKYPGNTGYEFSGWAFPEEGSQPATMPAKNVVATGTVKKKTLNYHVVYYTQELAKDSEGNTLNQLAETYTDSFRPAETISAEFGSTVNIADYSNTEFAGFSYQGAVVTHGKPQGGTTCEDIFKDTETATVTAAPAEGEAATDAVPGELYINLFYTRKQYSITLRVFQDEIATDNQIYSHTWDKEGEKYYFEAPIPETMVSTYETYESDTWQELSNAFAKEHKQGTHELEQNTIGWSTGTAPKTMPAGDVTVTRQFILSQPESYTVEVWVEDATENEFVMYPFTYSAVAGETVSIDPNKTESSSDAEEAKGALSLSAFSMIPHFRDYEYAEFSDDDVKNNKIKAASNNYLTGGTKASDKVKNTVNVKDEEKEDQIVLRIFLARRKYFSTINYYVIDTDGSEPVKLATVTKQAKWGHDYNYEPLAYFDGVNSEHFEDFNESTDTKAINPENTAGKYLSTNFREDSYVVSYSGYYYLDQISSDRTSGEDNDGQYTEHWPREDFDTPEKIKASYSGRMGYSRNSATDVPNSINVYYSKVDPGTQATIAVGINPSVNLNHGAEFAAEYFKDRTDKTPESGDITWVPLTYDVPMEGNTTKTLPVYLANEAYFYDAVYTPDADYSTYPGLANYNLNNGDTEEADGKYTYDSTKLKKGFSTFSDGTKTYYYDDSHVYIPVKDNSLFAGKRFTYDYKKMQGLSWDSQVEKFLTDYKTWAEKKYEEDKTAVGAHLYHYTMDSVIRGDSGKLVIDYKDGQTSKIHFHVGDKEWISKEYSTDNDTIVVAKVA